MKKTRNQKKWQDCQLDSFATVNSGRDIYAQERIEGDTPYITSGTTKNGIGYFVKNDNNSKSKNAISVNRNGAVGEAFYHPYIALYGNDCRRVNLIKANDEATQLFAARCISKQKATFSYSRKLGTARLKKLHVMLPVTDDGEPDYEYMSDYVKKHKEAMLAKYREYAEKQIAEIGDYVEIPALDEKEWGEFAFADIFDIQKGFYNKKPKDNGKGNIPFLGATDANNGVTRFLTVDTIQRSTRTGTLPNSPLDRKIFDGHAIAVTNNGSVGHAFYQATQFTCSHDINPLYLKDHEMSKAEAMFLIEAIEKQGKLFQYARKWRPMRMVKSKILLPLNASGNPDFEYMEQYAKNMMLRKYQQYFSYLEGSKASTNG